MMATALKSEMPYEYCDKDSMVPKWAVREDGRTWVPLLKFKNVSEYFNDYRVGVYELHSGTWHFELEGPSEYHDAWFPDHDSKTFDTGLESDDANESEYFLIADLEEFGGVAVVFVPKAKGVDVDFDWMNFEVDELMPRLTYLARAGLRNKVAMFSNSPVELHRLEKDSDDKLQQQCLHLILRRPNAAPLLKRLCDIYFLSTCDEKEQRVIAYALVTVCDGFRIGNHVRADTLVSCKDTFEPAHQLLELLSERFKLPAIPASMINEPYWHSHANDLVQHALSCWGWNFEQFLVKEIKGFDEFLVEHVIPTHHLFMPQS